MKKIKTSRLQARKWSLRSKRKRYVLVGTVGAVLLLALATIAGPWSPLPDSRMRTAFFSPPPPLPSPGNPSKEYIYAGGKLIATEEPNLLVAPSSLIATTFSSAQVNISWTAAPNAHHYVIERASQAGNFTTLNSNVVGTTYTDTTVANLTAYLYRVRSADAVGNVSNGSNIDLATAITFADDPFPSPPVFTEVRAQHIVQLRQAVNAARHLSPVLNDFPWTQSSQTLVGAQIKAQDVEELRTALDEAYLALGLSLNGYTDPQLAGHFIQKIYITELRDRVK